MTDVGCGSGLVAIAAALAGAARVRAFDRDRTAVEASRRNAAANGAAVDARVGDAADVKPTAGELVLAADVFYEEGPFGSAVERWAAAGAVVPFADAGRGILPVELGELGARLEARTEPNIETTVPLAIRRLVGV